LRLVYLDRQTPSGAKRFAGGKVNVAIAARADGGADLSVNTIGLGGVRSIR
jgi:hypothetical protein